MDNKPARVNARGRENGDIPKAAHLKVPETGTAVAPASGALAMAARARTRFGCIAIGAGPKDNKAPKGPDSIVYRKHGPEGAGNQFRATTLKNLPGVFRVVAANMAPAKILFIKLEP